MVVRASADPGSGLGDAEAQTLSNLLEDVLEGFGNCAVARAETLPDAEAWQDPAPDGLVIRLHPRKVGGLLALDYELAAPERIRRRQPWLWRTMTPTSPVEAYRSVVQGLPAECLEDRFETLIPGSSEAFWPWVAALGAGAAPQAVVGAG